MLGPPAGVWSIAGGVRWARGKLRTVLEDAENEISTMGRHVQLHIETEYYLPDSALIAAAGSAASAPPHVSSIPASPRWGECACSRAPLRPRGRTAPRELHCCRKRHKQGLVARCACGRRAASCLPFKRGNICRAACSVYRDRQWLRSYSVSVLRSRLTGARCCGHRSGLALPLISRTWFQPRSADL